MTPNTRIDVRKSSSAGLHRTSGSPQSSLAAETSDTVVVTWESTEATFAFDVAIVGLGYVGLPMALALNAAGRKMIGLDVSGERLEVIRSEQADLLPSDKMRLTNALHSPDFTMSADLSLLARAAAVIVCVPTPVDPYLVPDLGILRSAFASVVQC